MNFTEQIMANPSGGTVSLTGEDLPTTGYFVGGVVAPLVLEPSDPPAKRREMLDGFIDYLNGPTVEAAYLGWWTDEETGRVWVDGTSHHRDLDVAVEIGLRRHEIAIFDIERDREVRLAQV